MRKMRSLATIAAVAIALTAISVVSPASAAPPSHEPPLTAESLSTMTFQQAFGSAVGVELAKTIVPSDVFSTDVLARVPVGSSYNDIATKYPLDALYSKAQLVAAAKSMAGGQVASAGVTSGVHPNASFTCSPVCGIKFNYTETRVIVATVLAGNGALAQVACGFVPGFPLQAACKVAFAVYYASAGALIAVTLANNRNLCLVWAPYVPYFPFFATRC